MTCRGVAPTHKPLQAQGCTPDLEPRAGLCNGHVGAGGVCDHARLEKLSVHVLAPDAPLPLRPRRRLQREQNGAG